MIHKLKRIVRLAFILSLLASLTGCFYWWRVYQTYQQMSDFDDNFSISADEGFTLYFKEPRLYSEDFVSLAKLRPSDEEEGDQGLLWRYKFRKIDSEGQVIFPETSFFISLLFNQEKRILSCTFSPLFLKIAPAKFLEIAIRSVAKGKINKANRQLKVDTAAVDKISSKLPLKQEIIEALGDPIEAIDTPGEEIYTYYFLLEAHDIEAGYEERAVNIIKLFFNKQSQEMVKMSGNFAGLKISINYQNYQE